MGWCWGAVGLGHFRYFQQQQRSCLSTVSQLFCDCQSLQDRWRPEATEPEPLRRQQWHDASESNRKCREAPSRGFKKKKKNQWCTCTCIYKHTHTSPSLSIVVVSNRSIADCFCSPNLQHYPHTHKGQGVLHDWVFTWRHGDILNPQKNLGRFSITDCAVCKKKNLSTKGCKSRESSQTERTRYWETISNNFFFFPLYSVPVSQHRGPGPNYWWCDSKGIIQPFSEL